MINSCLTRDISDTADAAMHYEGCIYKKLHDLFLSLPADDEGYVEIEAAMRAMTERIVQLEGELANKGGGRDGT